MGTTTIDSRTGSTLLHIDNPDGSTTVVSMGRDGSVSRSTTRIDPSTGFETSLHRAADGTEVRIIEGPDSRIVLGTDQDGNPTRSETVIERPDENTTITRITAEDGSQTTVTAINAPDGTNVVTTEKPDGTVETVTSRSFTEPDGSEVSELVASDGSFSRMVVRPDGSSTSSSVAPDGTVTASEIVTRPDGSTTMVMSENGEVTSTIEEVPVPGGTRRTSTLADGSPPEVVTSTVHRHIDDQGREVVESKIEGPGLVSHVEVQIGVDGEGFSSSTDADGAVVQQRRTTFDADGTRVDEVTDPDGTVFVSRATPLPDGGFQMTTQFADGAFVVHAVDDGGHVTTTATSRNGVETVTDLAPDGSGSRVTTQPDGEAQVDTFEPDPPASRGVVFADDELPVADADDTAGDDANAEPAVAATQPGDAPVGSVVPDDLGGALTNRIRETTDTDDVDHADFDSGPVQPQHQQPHIEVELGPAHIEERPAIDIELGPATIEPRPSDLELELGPATFESGGAADQAGGAGATGLLGHPEGMPIPNPYYTPTRDVLGDGGGDGGTLADEARGSGAGGVVGDVIGDGGGDGGTLADQARDSGIAAEAGGLLDDVDPFSGLVTDDPVRMSMGGDDAESTMRVSGAGDTAQAIVDDLEARAQWLSDEIPTPLADLAREHAPDGLNPERLGMVAGAVDPLLQATNPAGTALGVAGQEAFDLGRRLGAEPSEAPVDRGPFPDDGTEDVLRAMPADDADAGSASVIVDVLEEGATTAGESAAPVIETIEQTAGELLDDPLGTLSGYVDDASAPIDDLGAPVDELSVPVNEPVYEEPVYEEPAPVETVTYVQAPDYVEPVAAAVEQGYETATSYVDEGVDTATSYADDTFDDAADAVDDFFSE